MRQSPRQSVLERREHAPPDSDHQLHVVLLEVGEVGQVELLLLHRQVDQETCVDRREGDDISNFFCVCGVGGGRGWCCAPALR